MTRLRRVHAAAAIIAGLAAAAALLGRVDLAVLLLVTILLMVVWSLETLRHHAQTEESR